MSKTYLVYRCTEGEIVKKPEAVINLWEEDVPRFAEILNEAVEQNPERALAEGQYWEIVRKEEADPYDWEKVTGGIKNKEHDPLGDMWRERGKMQKLMEQGASLEQALEIMTPFSHSYRYESGKKKKILQSMQDIQKEEG